jgi:hypothetical protein
MPKLIRHAPRNGLEAPQAALTLDEATPELRFQARVCWTGEAEVTESNIQIHAWATDAGNLVELRIGDAASEPPWLVRANRPDVAVAPVAYWSGDVENRPEEACTKGTTVTFTLLNPSAGPVELEWAVVAIVGSDHDVAAEDLALAISVEAI